ncbi:LOW QUALITY PROTEIN: 1-phosphatidylinositol 3-phosphate 5-kinase-like [Mercenaria mercenaria]|uniref:LOW QUALITY PROTEIN: 1-phosphatidylinositol 3-phosphate 5-kinase-like n=1 Tax=Mercenaria mercenaria TaxID=6596 RepID=UPI00234F0D44|nr:LOW QUALITY PROTEIN: 1-phosphatidylinositol 3-phosphate 5-kinase-like [Mercenaria mercenaria]
MSLWEDIPSTLTSFGPPSSEVQSSGNFLSRFFRRSKDESDQSSEGSKPSSREASVDRFSSREVSAGRFSSREPSVDSQHSREQSVDRSTKIEHTKIQVSDFSPTKTKSESSLLRQDESPDIEVTESQGVDTKTYPTKRTLGSVLTRLSAILESRAPTPQVYRDSDFKQYWMPDSSCRECYECHDKFTTFRRRHHCRICGQIFCHACCSQELPGKIIGYKGSIRVCTYCFKIVHRYAKKTDTSADPRVIKEVLNKYLQADVTMSPDIGVKGQKKVNTCLQSSLRSPSDPDISTDSIAPFDLTPQTEFVVADNFTSERKMLIQDSTQLRNLWTLMNDPEKGVEYQSYRVRLRTYQKCIAGNRVVDWLLKQDKVANRVQAIAIGQALIDAAFLDPIHTITTPFRDDFTLYRPTEIPVADILSPEFENLEDSLNEDNAPQWFQEIQSDTSETNSSEGHRHRDSVLTASQAYSDLSEDSKGDIKVDDRHFDEPLPRQNLLGNEDVVVEPIFQSVAAETEKSMGTEEVTGSWRTLNMVTDDSIERETFEKLQQEHHEHLTMMTKQLLFEENLAGSWADIIISTVDRVSLFVKPDVRSSSDDMDIRKYVHIKKIPGGSREQTGLLHGVIFRKNVAHKKMAHNISNPSVLLLQGSIEYQRVENKISYLEPQILQEEEFLRKNIKKITSLKPKPDVLVVEKSVSRLAQDFLLKAGITLIYNVKQSVMERLSRFLVTDIVASIDSLVRGVKLGFCHTFSVRAFHLPSGDTRHMLYFDGCATHLGCAVTLRGGSISELKRVKKIMNFMIYASYHSRLEMSFCMDEFLKPPVKDDLNFDLEQTAVSKNTKECRNSLGSELDETNKNSLSNSKNNSKEEIVIDSNVNRLEPTESAVSVDTGVIKNDDDIHDHDKNKNASLLHQKHVDTGVCDNSGKTSVPGLVDGVKNKNQTGELQTGSEANNVQPGFKVDKHETGSHIDRQMDLVSDSERISSFINFETTCDKKITSAETGTAESDTGDQPKVIFGLGNDSEQNAENFVENVTVCDSVNQGTRNVEKLLDRNQSPHGNQVPTPELRKKHPSGGKRDKSPHRKSQTTQLTDHSDPLYSYQMNQDESIFQSSITFQEQLVTHRTKFRKALDNVVLSSSPYIKYQLPYLETESGSKCELRKYFPEEIYWSSNFCLKSGQRKVKTKQLDTDLPRKIDSPSNIVIKEAHDFIRCRLTKPATDKSTQYMLAKFRAYGGRINIIDPPNQSEKKSKKSSNKGKQLSVDVKKEDNKRDSGVAAERKIDCLDPFRHQRIAVLFSSFSYESENHPSPCVYPWVVTMEFYGRNDTTLGGFLERFCFRPSYVCPSDLCNTSMDRHVRRFVHGRGCISLVLKRLDQPIPNGQNCILMWSWCHKCKQVTPVVPISPDTWNLSFSRYLEFRFHGYNFQRRVGAEPPCTHSLHHDHFQYFGFKDTVASFKYSTIKIKEIKVPPLVITHKSVIETILLYRLKDEVKRLTLKITDLFSLVLDCMTKMKAESMSENLAKFISDCISMQQAEKATIREMAHSVKEKLERLLKEAGDLKVISLNEEQRAIYGQIEDGIVLLKKSIAESVTNWNVKLQDVYIQQKKVKQGASQKREKDREPVLNSASSSAALEPEDKSLISSLQKSTELEGQTYSSATMFDDTFSLSGSDFGDARRKSDFSVLAFTPPIRKKQSSASADSYIYGVTPGISAAGVWHDSLSESYVVCHSDEVLSPPPASLENSIEKMTETDAGIETSVPGVTMATDEAVESLGFDVTLESTSIQGPDTGQKIPENVVVKKAPADDQVEGQTGDKLGTVIKKTIRNTIWQGSGAFQLQMPFDPCDHHLLATCDRVPVIVYDHEPSSVIAYSLSCHDYHMKLHEIQAAQRSSKAETENVDRLSKDEQTGLAKRPSSSKLSFFKGTGKETVSRPDTPDSVRFLNKVDNTILESPQDEMDFTMILPSGTDSNDKSKTGKQAINHHIELQFSDNTARFYCKVYFAEQFRHLRKHIFPDGEDAYIRSLSRCKPWEAKGGKSGSSFCKTDDDRFILKQMSNMEVESFERFGPEYFQYISSVEKQQRPTALAKIVGVYRIGFRNQYTNNAMKQDLLVVENLFYNRCISQTFDLKGSERNRLVKQTRKRDEELVLLDENFLRVSVDCPLYILSHSKTMLMLAISHDSQFLSSNLVMDYSLLVGLDEENKELVVGIIDYIRTFTWDKKLETIIKTNFGGQGKMPTVVSPEVYRTRFLDAMAKYFLPVPDQWTGLGRDVDT